MKQNANPKIGAGITMKGKINRPAAAVGPLAIRLTATTIIQNIPMAFRNFSMLFALLLTYKYSPTGVN